MDKITTQDVYREFTDKELKWIKKFEMVMKDAPSTLFMFVGAGMSIFPTDKENKRYMTENGGVDSHAPQIGIKTKLQYDGGDF